MPPCPELGHENREFHQEAHGKYKHEIHGSHLSGKNFENVVLNAQTAEGHCHECNLVLKRGSDAADTLNFRRWENLFSRCHGSDPPDVPT